MDPGHAPSAREQSSFAQICADSSEKMYSCSFCKKGFLNAQALGGHMNIHRKDRAKLILQSRDHNPNPVHDRVDVPVPGKTSTADDYLLQHAEHYDPPDDDRQVGTFGMQSSRILVESVPSMSANDDKVSDISAEILLEGKKIYGDLMLKQNSFPLELDLELRLGHDPHRG